MIVFIENHTNKAVNLNYNNESLYIPPNKSEKVDIDSPTLFEMNFKRNEKSFIQRIKEDFSVNEIDLKYLRFKIMYSSYLKTVVNVIPDEYKRQRLIITEKTYVKSNILQLICLDVENSKCIDYCKHKCVDRQHKLALYLSCKLAVFLKYGIIGIVGLPSFILLMFGYDASDDGAGVMVCYTIGFLISFILFIMFLVKSVWLLKIIKRI